MKHLFLDLEDTVITPVLNGWQNAELINIDLVRTLIEFEKPDRISLFSFALHNRHELDGFTKWVRASLEQALGIELGLIPTVDGDIIPACCRVLKLHPTAVSFQDAIDFWGKHESFRLFIRDRFQLMHKNWGISTEVILMDDAVINETWSWPDLNIQGRIIRV